MLQEQVNITVEEIVENVYITITYEGNEEIIVENVQSETHILIHEELEYVNINIEEISETINIVVSDVTSQGSSIIKVNSYFPSGW